MRHRRPMITDNDRRRLGTILQKAYPSWVAHPEASALEAELERARGVDPARIPGDVVTMNSTIIVRDLEDGDTQTYTLAYPDDADIHANRISVLAPLGRAILGSRVGDVVTVITPSGRRRIRVEAIDFQPERAGAYHL